MDFYRAKGIIREISKREGFELMPTPSPFEETSVIKPAADDLDMEIWTRVDMEANGDFGLITQIRTPLLTNSLLLSKKFHRFIEKINKALVRKGAFLQVDEDRLVLTSGLMGASCEIEDVNIQHLQMKSILWDLRTIEIPKKFKIDPLFVYLRD
jgi:hypothetical protein